MSTIDTELTAADVADETPERPRRRRSPLHYLRSIWAELRKVVWPSRQEVAKYSVVVLFTLLFMLAIILLLDYAFSKGALFLFR